MVAVARVVEDEALVERAVELIVVETLSTTAGVATVEAFTITLLTSELFVVEPGVTLLMLYGELDCAVLPFVGVTAVAVVCCVD